MRKGFALPLILAVVAIGLVAVGAIAYFQLKIRPSEIQPSPSPTSTFSPQPTSSSIQTPSSTDETADWKTFTNSSAGWKIKYPPDWTVLAADCGSTPAEQCDNVIITGTNVKNAECLDPNARCGSLQVALYGEALIPGAAKSGEDWVKNGNEKSNLIEPSQEIDIAGIKGYQETFQNNPGTAAISRTITILHNKKLYVVSYDEGYYQDNYHITSTKDWKLLNVFNTMLSTFKFLD